MSQHSNNMSQHSNTGLHHNRGSLMAIPKFPCSIPLPIQGILFFTMHVDNKPTAKPQCTCNTTGEQFPSSVWLWASLARMFRLPISGLLEIPCSTFCKLCVNMHANKRKLERNSSLKYHHMIWNGVNKTCKLKGSVEPLLVNCCPVWSYFTATLNYEHTHSLKDLNSPHWKQLMGSNV